MATRGIAGETRASGRMGRVATFLDRASVPVPCPHCEYPLTVELLDVRLQRRVFCPCCKAPIQLVDDRASMDAASEQIDAALRSLGFGS